MRCASTVPRILRQRIPHQSISLFPLCAHIYVYIYICHTALFLYVYLNASADSLPCLFFFKQQLSRQWQYRQAQMPSQMERCIRGVISHVPKLALTRRPLRLQCQRRRRRNTRRLRRHLLLRRRRMSKEGVRRSINNSGGVRRSEEEVWDSFKAGLFGWRGLFGRIKECDTSFRGGGTGVGGTVGSGVSLSWCVRYMDRQG